MPRPAHTLITWHGGWMGDSAAPLEEWQFGLRTGPVIFADDAARSAAATACQQAYATHIAPLMASRVRLDRTRVAQIGADGRVTLDAGGAYNQADDVTLVPGTGVGGVVWPTQLAVVVSLGSDRAGVTGKGRFFLPATTHPVQSGDGRLNLPAAEAIATACVDFLHAIDGALSTPGDERADVVIASTKGYLSPVTSVRVGRVLDTQRRRRGDMPEDYVVRTVSQAG